MKRILLLFALTPIQFFAQVPNYVPTGSLTAWYSFSGNAMDQSGNNNHCASFGGAVLSNDRFNNATSAYLLDGTNDYIGSTVNFFNSSVPHTIAMWWKTTDSLKTSQTFYSANPFFQEGAIFNHTLNGQPQRITYFLGTGAGSWNLNNSANPFTVTPNFSNWHHLIVVRNNTEWKYYDNGVLTHTFATASTGTAIAHLRFGAENNGAATRFFKGYIDDIGIWNRILTDCEIAQLYAAALSTVSAATSGSMMCLGETNILTANGATNYTWQPGGSNSSTIAVSPTITTTYTVLATNSVNTCSSSATVVQNVSPCTGWEESKLNSDLSIYPNPSNGQFEIVVMNACRIKILNASGQLIREIDHVSGKCVIEGLSEGIYFISAYGSEGEVHKKLLIAR